MIITDIEKLRVECEDVLPEEVSYYRELLEQELKQSAEVGAPGIGLALPQIGIAKRMAIVRVPNRDGIYSIDLVNCKIKAGYDLSFFNDEGCLSFPGKRVRTKRFQEVHVIDNLIEPHSFIATGLVAVCVAHELDHLDGILLPDIAV